MSIIRHRKPDRYTVIDNSILERDDLSIQSLGMLCYLLSRPDNWRVSVEHLSSLRAKSAKPVRRDGVYSILRELESLGYIERRQVADEGGKFTGVEYIVHDAPLTAEPLTAQPDTVQPDTANPTLTNTERATSTEKATSTSPATGKRSSGKVSFAEFERMCSEVGESRIPATDSVFAYADKVRLPRKFLALAWQSFTEYATDDSRKVVKYAGVKGWRLAFGKSIRDNWFKLWYMDNKTNTWELTTKGRQAEIAKEG